jgi:hypothetical protein
VATQQLVNERPIDVTALPISADQRRALAELGLQVDDFDRDRDGKLNSTELNALAEALETGLRLLQDRFEQELNTINAGLEALLKLNRFLERILNDADAKAAERTELSGEDREQLLQIQEDLTAALELLRLSEARRQSPNLPVATTPAIAPSGEAPPTPLASDTLPPGDLGLPSQPPRTQGIAEATLLQSFRRAERLLSGLSGGETPLAALLAQLNPPVSTQATLLGVNEPALQIPSPDSEESNALETPPLAALGGRDASNTPPSLDALPEAPVTPVVPSTPALPTDVVAEETPEVQESLPPSPQPLGSDSVSLPLTEARRPNSGPAAIPPTPGLQSIPPAPPTSENQDGPEIPPRAPPSVPSPVIVDELPRTPQQLSQTLQFFQERLDGIRASYNQQISRSEGLQSQLRGVIERFFGLVGQDSQFQQFVTGDQQSDVQRAVAKDNVRSLEQELGLTWGAEPEKTPQGESELATRIIKSGLMI